MDDIRSPDPRQARMPGHGKAKTIKNGLLPEVLPRNQSVPANPADCTDPNE